MYTWSGSVRACNALLSLTEQDVNEKGWGVEHPTLFFGLGAYIMAVPVTNKSSIPGAVPITFNPMHREVVSSSSHYRSPIHSVPSELTNAASAILHTMSASPSHVETEMATLAARFVNSTDRLIFLTGKAGTGKTTFLRRLAEQTHKRYIILAPTGIAALNAGGVTIHSQFLLPFGSFVPERKLPDGIPEYGQFHDRDTLTRRHPLNAIRRQVLGGVDLLIIDEVSMLRADLLDAIDHRMRGVRQRWDKPFGGVQVLMIGDLYQLPPVVKDEEWRVLQRWYRSPHFFEARALKEAGYAHIELDRIFRQSDDTFIRILNNLRENTVTPADVEALNAHYRAELTTADTNGVITLATHNRQADDINQRALSRTPGRIHRFQAEVEEEFPESMFPVARDLELKEGAQIMFTRNDPEKAYFNGKLARVDRIDEEGIQVRMVDDDATYMLRKVVWENKRYVVDQVTKEQKEEVLGTFTQFPVKLAWAITVHKSQGLTFDKAIIDVGQAFAPGQVYVALSRLRSLDGLILRTRISPVVVSTDQEVVAFSQRRHDQQPLPEQLHTEQHRYLQATLTSTFALGDLLKRAEVVQHDHAAVEAFEDEGMRRALPGLIDALRNEEATAQKFQGQLVRLLHADDRTQLEERVVKGAAYFDAVVRQRMKELLQHLAQVEVLSRSKQYADDLRELDGMLVKKLGSLDKAAHVTACILNGFEVTRRPEVEKRLAEQRTALVEQVRLWLVDNRPKSGNRTGRKRVRSNEDGTIAVRERKPKGERKIKGETYLRTYVLVKEGKDLAAIAAERGLSLGTIEGHAARGIAEGVIDIDTMMPRAQYEEIAEWMQAHADKSVNEARVHFGERYSYGVLRMVQAALKGGE